MCIALSWGVFSCVMMVHSDPYYTMHTTRHNGEDQNEPMRTKKRATSRSSSYS